MLPSEHLRRYHGIARETLDDYKKKLADSFVEGARIDKEGAAFVKDLVETLSALFAEAKEANNTANVEIKRLKADLIKSNTELSSLRGDRTHQAVNFDVGAEVQQVDLQR